MATIKATINTKIGKDSMTTVLVTWTSLIAASDVGAAFELPEWADNCVQIVANTAGGATCVLEGSNDGTVWGTLNNAQGSAISTAATLAPKQIVERPRYIRPNLSGTGGGTQDWTITLLVNRHTPLKA
jgi:hypothetical protein